MAFKKPSPVASVPDSPEKLFLELPRRRIPDVLPHQKEMMRAYASEAMDQSDVALQLPTGSGKTLVGLLIAEWRRRKNNERIVYLCPTRQLVNQVVEQAEVKYGLTIRGFTKSHRNYDPTAKAEYHNADRIAVTTYSSIFNTNPFFTNAEVIILDDAHVAENYISELWTLRVERGNREHRVLHQILSNVIKPRIDPINFTRLSGKWESSADRAWVDKIPTPELIGMSDEVIGVLDEHARNTSLQYPWSMLRDRLHACHMYLSSQDILIRPLIPPTWSHEPFCDPKQRIYMSATLGPGGDLERQTGRKNINRLAIPGGWDRQGVGRRFFIFPEMSLDTEEATQLRHDLMQKAGRSLVLVPSDDDRALVTKNIDSNLGFETFGAQDIEDSKDKFISSSNAVAIVANRYDGIDFPGEECRLLYIEGLPKAVNSQERFLMARMGANVLFNERIQTRVLQAIGRCTRSLEDYSAIVVSGEELTNYLADGHRRKYLHPELQAEIIFGIEQSKGTTLQDMIENFDIFLENGKEWEDVNQDIVANRKNKNREAFPAVEDLSNIVNFEIEFQMRLWQGDYEAALQFSDRVLGGLIDRNLRGYRALWNYLAGCAAWLGWKDGVSPLERKARTYFLEAKNAAQGISWLVRLSRQHTTESLSDHGSGILLMEQIEMVETILEELGTSHDRKFAKREKEILDGLLSKNNKHFENSHKLLGELLGFKSDNEETDGAPDPWWIAGDLCFVFEDHAGAQKASMLDVKKARQVSSHPLWIQENVEINEHTDIIPVLVTPVHKVKQGAVPHLRNVALWPLDEFNEWAVNAISIIRELRMTFVDVGDLVWRAEAARKFEDNELGAQQLAEKLRHNIAADSLEVVK